MADADELRIEARRLIDRADYLQKRALRCAAGSNERDRCLRKALECRTLAANLHERISLLARQEAA